MTMMLPHPTQLEIREALRLTCSRTHNPHTRPTPPPQSPPYTHTHTHLQPQKNRHPDTWYLWRLFGWTAPVACYAFFLVAVACNALLVRPLIPLVYTQAGGCVCVCMCGCVCVCVRSQVVRFLDVCCMYVCIYVYTQSGGSCLYVLFLPPNHNSQLPPHLTNHKHTF
jgi:hypothetical protein